MATSSRRPGKQGASLPPRSGRGARSIAGSRPDLDEISELATSIEGSDGVAATEMLAASFLALGQVPGAPAEAMSVALEAFEDVHDATAAAVLASVVAFARPSLAAKASAALARLHDDGVRSPLEEAIGTLEPEEAFRVDLDGHEVLVVVLGRPGEREVQVGLVLVDHETGNGAAVGGDVSPPGPRGIFDTLVKGIHEIVEVEPEPITVAELGEAVGRAFARTAEAGLVVNFDLGIAAPILSRALTGDPAAFAPLEVDGGHELPLHPGDEGELEEAITELAEHLVEVCAGDKAIERSGPAVVQSLLEHKWEQQADGCLGTWTADDLEDYLLDYFPREVSGSAELVADTPECVLAYLEMLDDHGVLEGDPAEVLAATVEDSVEDFVEAAADRTLWSPAKQKRMMSLLLVNRAGMRARGDGVARAKQRKSQRASRRRNRR